MSYHKIPETNVESTGNDSPSQSSPYVLFTNFQGTTRLTLQQHIWQEALGFYIQPGIPELSPSALVADVACGTASWLVGLSRQLGPHASLHGFDVNLNQAPPKQWLPDQVHLHTWNMFDDVPLEFVGKFDMVHVGLIAVVLLDDNFHTVIRNLHRLLRPGGYLQWDEVDAFHTFVVKADPELEVPTLDAWCDWWNNPVGVRKDRLAKDWRAKAAKLMQDEGFENVEQHNLTHAFTKRMDLMRYNNDQLLMMMEQASRYTYINEPEKGEKLLRMVEDAAKESEHGAVMIMPPMCWTALKKA